MATTEQAPASDHFIPTRVLRNNARFYAPRRVIELLEDVVGLPDFTLVVDVDAFERTTTTRIERVMVMGLEALARFGGRVVIIAREQVERAKLLQPHIFGSRLLVDVDSYEQVHVHAAGPLIGVTDAPALLRTLRTGDRGIALGDHEDMVEPNVTTVDGASLRASLWWLVDMRSKASGLVTP